MDTKGPRNYATAANSSNTRNPELSAEAKEVRMSLQYAVIEICAHQDRMNQTKTSSQALQALAELTFLYATNCLSQDLDAFSSHANRKTITVDDVRLMVRKSPEMLQSLTDYCEKQFSAVPSVRESTNSSVAARGKRSRALNGTFDSNSAMTEANRRRNYNAPPGKLSRNVANRSPASRRLEYDLTTPNSDPPKRHKMDDSSTSSEDSIDILTRVQISEKVSSGKNKIIQKDVDDDEDDDFLPVQNRNRIKCGTDVQVKIRASRRVIDSSSDSSLDELNDVCRNRQTSKLDSSSISRTTKQEKLSKSDKNEEPSQAIRIMSEMSPHSAPSEDDSDG